MAKQRYINTKFWSDPFIQELSPLERYFYLYLLTNEHTEINGVYEITLKTISSETSIPVDKLTQFVDRLRQFGKIEYKDNYIIIFNFSKHQKPNPSVLEGIKKANEKLPQVIKEIIQTGYRLGTDSPQSDTPKYKLKPEYKPESKLEVESPGGQTPSTITKDFLEMVELKDEKYLEFISTLSESKKIPLEIVRAEIDKFSAYWKELNPAGTKQRWQLEKTFEVQRRLLNWFSRINQGVQKSSVKQGGLGAFIS